MKNIENIILNFKETRVQSKIICEPLEIEDYVVQPRAEVSPPKWHLAHTTWFFEEMILKKHCPKYQIFDENFTILFNSYYKTLGNHWHQSERGILSRPTVNNVFAYRKHVDEALINFINTQPISSEVLDLLEIGIHHEKQHQELLLMDIKSILASNIDFPAYNEYLIESYKQIDASFSTIDEGLYDIGHLDEGFSYDNERPRHKVYVQSSKIQNQLITNGEFLDFINHDGYKNSVFWLSKGFSWINENNIHCPLYWRMIDNTWYEYNLSGLKPIDLDAPVKHISYYEANAYAKFRGLRLPTEFELEIFFKSNQVKNDLWNWSSSHYSPYPGFKEFSGSLGEYNGKFMCDQYVLRGGCFATPKNHLRDTYRNFFEPHQRWMFSGIRLAKD
ncbi:MAG: sulfatase maturase [Halobacteriovorax sp.]|nr:sulfatase maturase [Halobacteriovorax sp.]